MDVEHVRYALEELRFLAEVPSEVIARLADAASLQRAASGSVIFREGTRNANLYLLRKGKVALDMKVPGRGSVRILTLGPGEMIGWSALLGEGKMTAGAVALDDSELVVIDSHGLLRLCESDHHFGFQIMRRMAAALAQRLVATRLQLLDLFADLPAGAAAPVRLEPGDGP
ncbi:MAG: cyclic nucleotide-binding domain-containing protein [Planctomycetes bacterium]|nr:cyclic nucleotide-binding domain-containing protein [Planctomycetota bacterium]